MNIFDAIFAIYFVFQFVAVVHFILHLRVRGKRIYQNIKRRRKNRKQDIVEAEVQVQE